VRPQPEEGLPGQLVVAAGAVLAQAPDAPGAGEAADGHGEAVHERDERVVLDEGAQVLPHALPDAPQVRGLAHERGPVHPGQPREQVPAVAAEVGEDLPVLVKLQVSAHGLHGQDLTVEEARLRPPPAQPRRAEAGGQGVVNGDEGGYNERVQVHRVPPASV
jgi:hypothetical protein